MGSSIETKQYPVADKVEYIIALVSEFGKAHSLTDSQAWRYIKRYGGVKLMDEHSGFMHTQSFTDMVADMTTYLNRQGGKLVRFSITAPMQSLLTSTLRTANHSRILVALST